MTAKRWFLVMILVASLALNGVLGALYLMTRQDVQLSREGERERADERELLLGLIPGLHPTVSQDELARLLSAKYSNEPINRVDRELQWRLFHFRFNERGQLVQAAWGS